MNVYIEHQFEMHRDYRTDHFTEEMIVWGIFGIFKVPHS